MRDTNGTGACEHLKSAGVNSPLNGSLSRSLLLFGATNLSQEMDLLAVLQHDIAVRLRAVCGNLPQQEFDKLVCDIAAVKLKYGVEAELSAAFRERLTAAVEEQPTNLQEPLSEQP
jgi:hypothetical protein